MKNRIFFYLVNAENMIDYVILMFCSKNENLRSIFPLNQGTVEPDIRDGSTIKTSKNA